jgi:hypothetical protein
MQSSSSSKSNSFVNELTIRILNHSLRFRINDDNVIECDLRRLFSSIVKCDFSLFLNVVEDDFFFSFKSQRNRVSFFARVLFVARDATTNSNLMSNEKRLRTIAQHHMILKRLYMTKSRAAKRRTKRVETKKM